MYYQEWRKIKQQLTLKVSFSLLFVQKGYFTQTDDYSSYPNEKRKLRVDMLK